MADKNPYEIRMDLLKMSHDYLMDMYTTQRDMVERQMSFAEDVLRSVNKEAINEMAEAQKNFDIAVEKMSEVMKSFPTQNMILETAKQFQEFVNKK
jgi:ATP-dependent protease Clp ATPase subunit